MESTSIQVVGSTMRFYFSFIFLAILVIAYIYFGYSKYLEGYSGFRALSLYASAIAFIPISIYMIFQILIAPFSIILSADGIRRMACDLRVIPWDSIISIIDLPRGVEIKFRRRTRIETAFFNRNRYKIDAGYIIDQKKNLYNY